MSIIASDALPPAPLSPPAPLPKRGHPLLAWLVIVAAVGVAIGFQLRASRSSESERLYLSIVQLQGRLYVGVVRNAGPPPPWVDEQVQEGINRGPYAQRLRFVVLDGEFRGPKEALADLQNLRDLWEQHPPSDEDKALTELLDPLYQDYARDEWNAPSLSDDDRRELRRHLDWFGDLALAPAQGSDRAARAAVLDKARRTFILEIVSNLLGLLVAAFGLFLLGLGCVLLAAKMLRLRFLRGSRDGGVYAETFALWMLLYMLLGYLSHFIPAGNTRLLVSGLVGLTSLAALAWPVLRGVPWRRVRQDLGWWTPGPVVLEPLWGLACYIAFLPVVILGLLLSSGMLNLYRRIGPDDPFAAPLQPSHPVGEMLLHADWWMYLQIFLVAAVFAPLIEETMFRGVLYRHLREVGTKWPRWVSVLFSAFVVSFLFAVIHPQGVFGVPVLMALALGFAMARELRGSLVGSMAAHGLSNALVTLIGVLMN